MKNITQAVLTNMLSEVRGTKFATLVMETPLDMRKTGNPYAGRVTKRSTVNVTLNFNYGNALNKILSKQVKRKVTTEVGQRAWGDRVGKTCFIMHKGGMYLNAKCNAKPSQVMYFVDGVAATPGQVKEFNPFIPAKAPQQVPMVNVHVNNIREVKIDKQHFVVQ